MRSVAHLLLCSLLATLNACSGKPIQTQTPRLELSIFTDKQQYRIEDSLRLETRFTNSGAKTFYLFDDLCWNPGNLLNIHTFNASGEEVFGHSDILRDCIPPPPKRDDTSRFVEMEPGSFEASTEKFDVRELVPGPGEYDLVVRYHSGISKDWLSKYGGAKIAALDVWTSEYSELASNRLHILVKP